MKPLLVFFTLFTSINLFAQETAVYISDAGNFNNPPWQILKVDENGENPTVFIDTQLNWPQDILFLEDQNIVLISNLGTGKISKYNPSSGAYLGDFAIGIGGPTRIKIGADGLLYVLQWAGNGKVKRYQLDGTFVDDFTATGVAQSIGIDWDKNGNLYVSSYNGDKVQKFSPTGEDLGAFINNNLAGPTNIWFNDNGDLLVSDYDGTAVKRFDSTGQYLGDFLTGLKNSEGVDFLPNGNILIGNGATHSVKMFSSSGEFIKDFVPPNSGGLLTPNGVTIRQIPTSSISESQLLNQHALYPLIGTQFRIAPSLIGSIDSLLIYGATGKKVTQINQIDLELINASNYSEGMYLVLLQLKNGTTKIEKIMVKK